MLILELFPGEGGRDSELFASDLAQALFKSFAGRLQKISDLMYEFSGDISELMCFSGSHVVQRIPPTERHGRMHTSIVGIAIYEASRDPNPELDIEYSYCHTKKKAGGQNSNKVQSTVRAKDLRTGTSVRIDGRDQHRNKERAGRILLDRVKGIYLDMAQEEKRKSIKQAISNNSRGCRDFTWNFREDRLIIHATGKIIRNLRSLLRGELRELKE